LLTRLRLEHNELTELSDTLCTLKNLVYLTIRDNKPLCRLPRDIGKMDALTELHAHGCALTEIPESIGELLHIVVLSLAWNRIEKLPASLCKLTSLRDLQLSGNKLRGLPADIGCMRSLKRISARNILLSELPTSIGALSELIFLDAKRNRLQCLPREMERLKQLNFLDLRENPDLTEQGVPVELDVLTPKYAKVDPCLGDRWPLVRPLARPAGKRLQLKKRTVPDSPAAMAATRPPSIFGSGAPRDESRRSQQSP